VIVPANPIYKKGELEHIFSDSGAKAFVGHRDYLDEPVTVMESLPEMTIRIVEGKDAPPGFTRLSELFVDGGKPEAHPTDSDDPLAIIYTSGTTGLPKGAVLTHGNLMGDVLAVSGLRQSQPDDVVLCVLPLFHIYGQTHVLNLSIHTGLTMMMWTTSTPGK